jgi:hypothetical protein
MRYSGHSSPEYLIATDPSWTFLFLSTTEARERMYHLFRIKSILSLGEPLGLGTCDLEVLDRFKVEGSVPFEPESRQDKTG